MHNQAFLPLTSHMAVTLSIQWFMSASCKARDQGPRFYGGGDQEAPANGSDGMVLLKQAKHQNWKVNKGEKLPAYPQWRQGRLRQSPSGCFLLQVRGPLMG